MGLVRQIVALGIVIAGVALGMSACKGSTTSDGGACERTQSKLRGCELLSAGRFNCAILDELSSCEVGCVERASCLDLEISVCGSGSTTLQACLDGCTGGFTCANGESIEASWQCDGEPDCNDGSDEVGCQYFVCASGMEIPLGWQCDDWDDCGDGSDEAGCATRQFTCADGSESVPTDWVCDLEPDCSDGSDEAQGCAAWVCD